MADLFSYETVDVKIDDGRATVTGLITLPQTEYISALLADRLFDASLPPVNDRELQELVTHENWQYVQQTVRHELLQEEYRWYMFYDFETEETVAGLLRRAESVNDPKEISGLLEARDAYEEALALQPESKEAQTGLVLVTQRIASLKAKNAYIKDNLELFDFIAKDYRQDHPENKCTPGITFKLRNNGDMTLSRVVVRITFFNADGGAASRELLEPLKDFPVDGQKSVLAPGMVWEFKKPAFYMTVSPTHSWQEAWQNGNAKAEIIDIEFEE